MKIVRFAWGDAALYGILEGDTIYSLHGDLFGEFHKGKEKCALGDARLLAPVQPSKIVAIGFNYPRPDPMGPPMPFFKVPTCLVAQGEPVVLPPETQDVVMEAELAVVIGRRAHRVSVAEAMGYILGYTCVNDITARDITRQEGKPIRSKNFDTFCPLGPAMETELDPADVRIVSRINGVVKQDGRTSQMVLNVPKLVSQFSHMVTLLPGDVILSGTPGTPPAIQAGDVMEVEVQGIGVLRNPVTRV
ncbi:MAG: fumarylacetoacetate hydrolase family protein [Chloroflexi bacterium]|nr:fumarylacetoacetate hydrolase family protein [Chloroflexota bacterium]